MRQALFWNFFWMRIETQGAYPRGNTVEVGRVEMKGVLRPPGLMLLGNIIQCCSILLPWMVVSSSQANPVLAAGVQSLTKAAKPGSTGSEPDEVDLKPGLAHRR